MAQREIDLPHTKTKNDALAVYLWWMQGRTVKRSRMKPRMKPQIKPRVPTVPPTVHTR